MEQPCILRRSIRCKRKSEDFPYLPREIIFNVLSWLPAEFLHNHVKYVCKSWANIIRDPSFVGTHLLRSNADSLLIQNRYENSSIKRNLHCLQFKEGKLTVARRKTNINRENERMVIVVSSEGIWLCLRGNPRTLHVTNLVTKQSLKLPFIYPKTCKVVYLGSSGLAFIPHTRELKVIIPWIHHGGYIQYSIFTVGIGPHIGREIDPGVQVMEEEFFHVKPVPINGVVFWIPKGGFRPGHGLLAIDLGDEIFHSIKIPEKFQSNEEARPQYLRMDIYLSCIVHGGTEINVWILKNIVKSEWTITRKIELPSVVGLMQPLLLDIWRHIPIAWFDNTKVILFIDSKREDGNSRRPFAYNSSPRRLFAYNLSTGVIKIIIKNVNLMNVSYGLLHANTLVAW